MLNNIEIQDLDKLIKLRKQLHKNPELSGKEKFTSETIAYYISLSQPDEILTGIGGNGIIVIYKGKEEGPNVVFRAELDALPIEEENTVDHISVKKGISHACGHDGHMAILLGLGSLVSQDRPKSGSVMLLFQPAEETGKGAARVLKDSRFKKLNPDYVFALHNLPGVELNKVIYKEDVFACASIGLKAIITGKTSHASEPEKGNNPAFIVADILKKFQKFSLPSSDLNKIKIITPIYIKLGKKALGTNAGATELIFTIRASDEDDYQELKRFALSTIIDSINSNSIAGDYKLDHSWIEEFPITANNIACNNYIKQSATNLNLDVEKAYNPFRWSEDFGHFTKRYKGAMFGLGSGNDQPALHNPDYDFPDELINTGSKIFYEIYRSIIIR